MVTYTFDSFQIKLQIVSGLLCIFIFTMNTEILGHGHFFQHEKVPSYLKQNIHELFFFLIMTLFLWQLDTAL